MSAREEILARVRAALAPGPGGAGPGIDDAEPAAAAVRDYLAADDPAVDRVALLAARLLDYSATVHRCDPTGLPGAVAAALAGTRRVVVPPDLPREWLARYPGEIVPDLPPLAPADLDDPGVSVVTGCAAAIAETGTIVLDAGPRQGRRVLTLVPDHQVCVVHLDQIAVSVPVGLTRLPDPRRPLTMISGPSATSDIELSRVEGVHGPRRLDVILVR
jgi:L-lactate dehydrogenase complex protein LldG